MRLYNVVIMRDMQTGDRYGVSYSTGGESFEDTQERIISVLEDRGFTHGEVLHIPMDGGRQKVHVEIVE